METKTRQKLYTRNISKELLLNSCQRICIEFTGLANRPKIPISHIRTDDTPTVTARALVTGTLTVTDTTPVSDVVHFNQHIKVLHNLTVRYF